MAVYISERKKRRLLALAAEKENDGDFLAADLNPLTGPIKGLSSPSLSSTPLSLTSSSPPRPGGLQREGLQLMSPPPSSPLRSLSNSKLNEKANRNDEKQTPETRSSKNRTRSDPFADLISLECGEVTQSSGTSSDKIHHTISSSTNGTSQKNTILSMFSAKKQSTKISIHTDANENAVLEPIKPTPLKPVKSLIQAQLLVGVESQKTCPLCGMSYSPVLKEDVKSHDKLHGRYLRGRPWPKSYGKRIPYNHDFITTSHSEYIVKIDASSKPSEKAAVQDILDLVNSELNAPPENPYWRTRSEQGAAFVYVKDKRATSLLIVERITQAYVMDAATGQLTDKIQPAIIGVSRIFTVKECRSLNMASKLLDSCLSNFIYALSVPKNRVAWSQPTASGLKLAQRWTQFDPTYKTALVYLEEGS
ncbi:Eco1p [Sugiyamaella lignohabitans]|uniref:N-acetyltransferase ECO1 n=1 Tax=Sugiyamaella lignohabitans TaxID=796027 RepID=A0A167DDN6_9ASCO|nr:Eco1p [Sugiyamaella lignohabitans]ANB12796.1 Eco1p [Sugiyamaella lignohabitans]